MRSTRLCPLGRGAAPMIKVLEVRPGWNGGFMTIIHAYTGDHQLGDGLTRTPIGRDPRPSTSCRPRLVQPWANGMVIPDRADGPGSPGAGGVATRASDTRRLQPRQRRSKDSGGGGLGFVHCKGIVPYVWRRCLLVTRSCEERTTSRILVCPTCEHNVMEAVSDGEMTNFRCLSCGACWHIELGWVSRVDPSTCPGCEHRTECMAAKDRG